MSVRTGTSPGELEAHAMDRVGLLRRRRLGPYLERLLPAEEVRHLAGFANPATQLIDRQAQELKELRAASRSTTSGTWNCSSSCATSTPIRAGASASRSSCRPGITAGPAPGSSWASSSSCFPGHGVRICCWVRLPPPAFRAVHRIGLGVPDDGAIGDYSENPSRGWATTCPCLALPHHRDRPAADARGEGRSPPIEPKNG